MNQNYHYKPIEELTFTDNGMFQAVLRKSELCEKLVERLLHVKVSKIEYPELEKQIAPFYTTKGVRLDVYLKDENKIIDIEIQSYRQIELGKRSRYYQSMIDIDSLMKGQSYPELKESYILFICQDDPFLKDKENAKDKSEYFGLPCYTFENVCKENSLVNLNDKSVKVIYNASAYEKEQDEHIQEFLRYVYTGEPGEDDFVKQLAETVDKLKEDEKFRSDYAGMNLHDWDITQLAKKEKAEEVAIELLKEGDSPEKIARCIGLPLEKVLELQESITVKA